MVRFCNSWWPHVSGGGSEACRVLAPQDAASVPSENHLLRALHECYAENNGTTQRFIMRCIFNREEFMRFDSAVGEFRALTAMGRPWAESWNKQKDYMERRRSEVDTVCRHNYELSQGFTVKRRVRPKVHVSPSKKVTLKHHDLLVCHVTDFYPGSIQVRWFQNSQEETTGVVSTNLIRNGDWTFQILVMLEMTPQRGDVYMWNTPALRAPSHLFFPGIQSDSARNKMLTGVVGLVLGLIFLAVGILKHVWSKQGLLSMVRKSQPELPSQSRGGVGEEPG
uniref:RT1 class II, locus Hb, pseudogene 1 n=1 Tax=Rattus norvegicus TaxID=10116 RepID=A0ABK0LWX7_RAT